MSYLADDSATIKARLEEIAAEKWLALTGSMAPTEETEKEPGLAAYMMGHDYDPA